MAYKGSSPAEQGQNQIGAAQTAADDEALARQLQEQYDRESRAQQPLGGSQTPYGNPSSTAPANSNAASLSSQFRQRWDRLTAPPPEDLCMGCKKAVVTPFGGSYLTACGGKWHPGTWSDEEWKKPC